jgi:DNA-binding transcriptional LysR family regulator
MPTDRAGRWADIEVFCRAAEFGRFAAAAEALGLPPSSVSRAIQRLEARLGVPLFTRTTRRVVLTEDGAMFFQAAREGLQQVEDAEHAVGSVAGRPVGRFRIAVPTTYGAARILPRMPAFARQNPGLDMEIHITNRAVDVVEENFDLVVRLGVQAPSALVQHTLETLPIGTFAAPSYLAERGVPGALDDLARHVCIGFVYPGSGQVLDFEFLDRGRPQRRPPGRGPTIVHDPLGMVALGLAGGGLFQTGHYVVQEHLDAGRLVEVLAAHAGVRRPIVALFPANRRLSPKVRAFFGFFARHGHGRPASADRIGSHKGDGA